MAKFDSTEFSAPNQFRTTIRTQTITPEMAEQFLAQNYERNRKLNDSTVDQYANAMNEGTWRPEIVNFCFAVLPDGRMVLVNGQHGATAQVKSGKTFVYAVKYIAVRNMEDVGELYALYDRDRSSRDQLLARRMDEKLNLNSTQLLHYSQAITRVIAGFRKGKDSTTKTRDDSIRCRVMFDFVEQAHRYYELVGQCRVQQAVKGAVTRATIMGCGLVALKDDRLNAENFLCGAFENEGLVDGDGRRMFSDYMKQSSHEVKHRMKTLKATQQATDLIAFVNGWNLFKTGRLNRVFALPTMYQKAQKSGLTMVGTSLYVPPQYTNTKRGEAKVEEDGGDDIDTTVLPVVEHPYNELFR